VEVVCHPGANRGRGDARKGKQENVKPETPAAARLRWEEGTSRSAVRWPEGYSSRGQALAVHDAIRKLSKLLQFLAWFETDGLSWGYRNLGARARIASDAGFPGPDIEDPETAELDPLSLTERALHALEHGLHGHFGLRLRDAGPVDDFVDDIRFYQNSLLEVTG
jgi:hypothetical protein